MENDTSMTINITDENGTWYLTKGDDSTHFEMVNNLKWVGKFGANKHINEFRTMPWYADVKSWLKGGQSPDGKTYN